MEFITKAQCETIVASGRAQSAGNESRGWPDDAKGVATRPVARGERAVVLGSCCSSCRGGQNVICDEIVAIAPRTSRDIPAPFSKCDRWRTGGVNEGNRAADSRDATPAKTTQSPAMLRYTPSPELAALQAAIMAFLEERRHWPFERRRDVCRELRELQASLKQAAATLGVNLNDWTDRGTKDGPTPVR